MVELEERLGRKRWDRNELWKGAIAYLGEEGRRLVGGAEEFGGAFAFGVFDFAVVEEADGGAAVDEEEAVVLFK